MESSFDYDSAMSRVRKELDEMTENLWPEFENKYKSRYREPPDISNQTKTDVLRNNRRLIDTSEMKKFEMLYELADERYWHANNDWTDICGTLKKEDTKFYAQLMIERAKKESENERLGYAWIVKCYDDDKLKEFISEDMLKEAVNRGFWEFANKYFVEQHFAPPYEYYDTLMKYSELLDLTRVSEFKKGVLTREHGWVDKKYVDCFERARQNLPVDDAAWLARPIIDSIISEALQKDVSLLERYLKPYSEYLETALIQELLKENIEHYVAIFCDRMEGAHYRVECIDALSKYSKMSVPELKDFVSSKLQISVEQRIKMIVETNFPKKYLTADALSKIQEGVIKYLDEPLRTWESHRQETIIPHLDFLQKSLRTGFLDENVGREKISKRLADYLARKRRPGGKDVEILLDTLDRKYVEPELYRRVGERAIIDLEKRKRHEAAEKWARVLHGESVNEIKVESQRTEPKAGTEQTKFEQTKLDLE